MPDEPKPPLAVFTEHAKGILGLGATVAGAVFGTAHWLFYERLDVRPTDVGFGPAEILSQAALGLVLSALVFAFLMGVLAAFYWLGWSTAEDWASIRGRRSRMKSLGWEQALAMGVIGAGTMVVGIVVATCFVVALGNAALPLVLVAMVGTAGVIYVEGWRDRRRVTSTEPPDRGRVGWAALLGFAVLVVPMAALVAVDDARAVRRGIAPASLLHSLVGGPVTCVEPTPSPGTTRYLLHLGTGDTHEVLYWPGHGPVRVPAGDVVLLPVASSRCRPSP